MIGNRFHLWWSDPVACQIDDLDDIVSEAGEEEVDDTDEPERSESDKNIWSDRAFLPLNDLTDDVGESEENEEDTVDDRIHTEGIQHPIAMDEYIGIDGRIEC